MTYGMSHQSLGPIRNQSLTASLRFVSRPLPALSVFAALTAFTWLSILRHQQSTTLLS
jgi:hypothetical protein